MDTRVKPAYDSPILLSIHRFRRRRRRGRRNRQSDPCRPSFGPILRGKILVSLQIHVAAVALGDGKQKSDLRADSQDTPLEFSKLRPRPAVAGELLEVVAGQADLDVLADELGS